MMDALFGLCRASCALVGGRLERLSEATKLLAGPVSAWHRNEWRELRFLVERGLRPHHRLIDIGCGPLRGGVPLIAYLDRGNYFGFDVRKECVEVGLDRVARRGLNGRAPLVKCGSFDLDMPMADYGLAFSVFIHLTDSLVDDAMRFVRAHVREVCFANVMIDSSKRGKWGEFPSLGRTKEAYQEAASRADLSLEWLEKKPWEVRWWFRHEVMVLRPN